MALGGGGTNGAWEAGLIWGLMHYGDPTDYEWDVVTGVSAGSIGASFMSLYDKGNEVAASEAYSHLWASTLNPEVWSMWPEHPHNFPGGCEDHSGCFNDDAFLAGFRKLASHNGDIKRNFTLGSVNVNDGEYITFNQDNISIDELGQAVVSSCSIPMIFPP